jgi:hypothetical protein
MEFLFIETIPVGTTDNSVADLPIRKSPLYINKFDIIFIDNEIDHFAVEPILEIEPTNDNAGKYNFRFLI